MHHVNRLETSKAKQMLAPVALSEATAQTQWIDRQDNAKFDEGEFLVNLGAVSGSPSATSIILTLQTSVDKSTVTTAKDLAEAEIVKTLTAGAQLVRVPFAPEACDRYIRLQYAVDFTGGSSPAVIAGITLLLEGARRVPVDSAAIATE